MVDSLHINQSTQSDAPCIASESRGTLWRHLVIFTVHDNDDALKNMWHITFRDIKILTWTVLSAYIGKLLSVSPAVLQALSSLYQLAEKCKFKVHTKRFLLRIYNLRISCNFNVRESQSVTPTCIFQLVAVKGFAQSSWHTTQFIMT